MTTGWPIAKSFHTPSAVSPPGKANEPHRRGKTPPWQQSLLLHEPEGRDRVPNDGAD